MLADRIAPCAVAIANAMGYESAVDWNWLKASGPGGASSTDDVTARRLDELPDARLRDLGRYWFARCTDGVVPRRSDIDPLDFKPLLPNVMLLDRIIEDGRERFRFRLVGTTAVEVAGRELTGRFLDESLPASYRDYVRTLNQLALRHRRPVYSSSLYHDQGNFVNGLTYRLILPLRTGAEEPDMIFACQFWQRREDRGHWSGDWRSVAPEIALVSQS